MENSRALPKLKKATKGNVVTRFPPEASGYLHLGHLKALLINHLYAQEYEGRMILRFDDTNPDKESSLYEQAILEDIRTLNIAYGEATFASDYFDNIIDYAKALITKGLAYVDFSSAEEINMQRINLDSSPYRNTDSIINQDQFAKMCNGTAKSCCLRAKIDYTSKNGCMRDPVIFRQKEMVHPRHGTKYKIYPTYDFACPILDAIQGVTHAMRSTEYLDRDSQYRWFLTNLNLWNGIYPLLMDYGRMSFTHTVLSKRNLAKLVEAGLVDGWSDPRMPTLRGVWRCGIQVEPLIKYIKTQLTSRSPVLLSWDKLYSFNQQYLDKICSRFYGLSEDIIVVTIVGDLPKSVQLANHPKKQQMGTREMSLDSTLLVEKSDFANATKGSRYTLVGLGNATIVQMDHITLQYDKNDVDYKSTTKITWLPNDNQNVRVKVKFFDRLLSKAKKEENDNILEIFNKDSVKETHWWVEPSLINCPVSSVFQIMRKHYCYLDERTVLHIVPFN